MPSRVEALRAFLAQRPKDPFSAYALAMELRATASLEEACQVFADLVASHPDYVAAYGPAGDTLARLGRFEEARRLFEQGLEACTRQGQRHAADQLRAALSALG